MHKLYGLKEAFIVAVQGARFFFSEGLDHMILLSRAILSKREPFCARLDDQTNAIEVP